MLPFRRAVSLAIAVLIFIQVSNAQNAWLDSLRMDLSRQRQDTNTINTLLFLSWSFQKRSVLIVFVSCLCLDQSILNESNHAFWALPN